MSYIRDKWDTIEKEKSSGFKNLIINGGLDIFQEGESKIFNANETHYCADMFLSKNYTFDPIDNGQFTISKGNINGRNSLKTTVNIPKPITTNTSYWHGNVYSFEGNQLYRITKQGKDVTLSFLFNSNISGEFPILFQNYSLISGVPDHYLQTFNYNTPNIPMKVEVTIPFSSFNGIISDNNNRGFRIVIGFLGTQNYVYEITNQWTTVPSYATPTCVNWGETIGNFWEIAEIQLEEGNKATSFENIPSSLTFSLCQRYFEKISYSGSFDIWEGCASDDHNYCYAPSWIFKTKKRVVPAILTSSIKDNTSTDWRFIGCTSWSIAPTKESCGIVLNGTIPGKRCYMHLNVNSWIAADARF